MSVWIWLERTRMRRVGGSLPVAGVEQRAREEGAEDERDEGGGDEGEE